MEMCTCSCQQKIISNSKSVVENDIDNKYDDNVAGNDINITEEKKIRKKIIMLQ